MKYLIFFLLIFFFNIQIHTIKNYKHLVYKKKILQSPDQLIIHTLEINPQCYDIVLHRAQHGAESVYQMAQETGAIAAINGGIFRFLGTFKNTPLGLLVIDRIIHTDLQFLRGTIAWNNNGTPPTIAPINIAWHLNINGQLLPIDRINQPRADNEAIVYTSEFKPTTLTNNNGIEITIENNNVFSIKTESGNNKIPKSGFVYSVGIDTYTFSSLKNINVGDHVNLFYDIQVDGILKKKYSPFQYMLSGSGLLIYNNTCSTKEQLHKELLEGSSIFYGDHPHIPDYHNTKNRTWLIEQKHPRTAVGVKKNGNWLFIVVEGNRTTCNTKNSGITLPDLAHLMQSLKCIYALNLDGGSSSTLYYNGAVQNKLSRSFLAPQNPIHQNGRSVTDAFLIFPKHFKKNSILIDN
ncbi:phosphodiester glycosidase family protein [Candidatus Dependentiae bacterium]|nr:phosphodiester glycosidase family protein [Candidatus Dependentiae bacterium]